MRKYTITALFSILIALTISAAMCASQASDEIMAAPDPVVVILGDSNIWLAGDSCNKQQGWMKWWCDISEPSFCLSYARSGATWSNTATTKANTVEDIAVLGNDNVIYNQVLRLRQAYEAGAQPYPTMIMISAGGNDAWFAAKRPDEFSLTIDEIFSTADSTLIACEPHQVLSLAGAIRHNCMLLQQIFPDATIVLLTPTPMAKVEPDMLQRVSDIIQATGNRMGLHTIRLDLIGPICRDVEMQQHINTYDGIHTTPEGAQKVAQCVYHALDSIYTNRQIFTTK